MGKVIVAVVLTLIGGIFTAFWEPGFGIIVAIAIMGGFILFEIQKK